MPPIAAFAGTGFALTAMRIEADALTHALRAFHSMGITALPIHDAVAVSHLHADTAKRVMEDSFRSVVGVEGLAVVEVYSKTDESYLDTSPPIDQWADF